MFGLERIHVALIAVQLIRFLIQRPPRSTDNLLNSILPWCSDLIIGPITYTRNYCVTPSLHELTNNSHIYHF